MAPRDPSYGSILGVCRAEASVCATRSAALSGWSLSMRVRQRLGSLWSLQPSREHRPDGAQHLSFVCVQKCLLSCTTLTHVEEHTHGCRGGDAWGVLTWHFRFILCVWGVSSLWLFLASPSLCPRNMLPYPPPCEKYHLSCILLALAGI